MFCSVIEQKMEQVLEEHGYTASPCLEQALLTLSAIAQPTARELELLSQIQGIRPGVFEEFLKRMDAVEFPLYSTVSVEYLEAYLGFGFIGDYEEELLKNSTLGVIEFFMLWSTMDYNSSLFGNMNPKIKVLKPHFATPSLSKLNDFVHPRNQPALQQVWEYYWEA